jgi:hypothetical protein
MQGVAQVLSRVLFCFYSTIQISCQFHLGNCQLHPHAVHDSINRNSISAWRLRFGVFFFFFLFSFSRGVRLSPLGTAATVWPIVPAPHDR